MQNTLERLRQRKEEQGREGGFTLIELLIVIVVLGILAAIVVFAVQNLTSQSAKSACGADFKTTETAAEAYKAQVGNYPATIGALAQPGTDQFGNPVGPWMKEVPGSSHYTVALGTGVAGSAAGTIGSFPAGQVIVSPTPNAGGAATNYAATCP